MSLKELSSQYRRSGELCRGYARRLEGRIAREPMSRKQLLELRRELAIVSSMAREAIATSNYLERYYDRRGVHHEQ